MPQRTPARSRRSGVAAQAFELARRSTVNTWRQPQAWVPGLFFPMMLTAVYTAQFAKAIHQPGFPVVHSYLDFVLPASILQAVAFGATGGAAELAKDIENGFFDRLVSSPVSRVSILVGRIAGSAVFAGFQAIAIMLLLIAFGVTIKGGVAGAIVIVATAVLLALGIGGLGLTLALRSGSQEIVQSTFPVLFVMLFVSGTFWPTNLMKGTYGSVARHNPITWIIEPLRQLVIEGWSWSAAGRALGITIGVAVATTTLAFFTMRSRLRRL